MKNGLIDHTIATRLNIDDLCAILAIVYSVSGAEYALGGGACLIDCWYFEHCWARFTYTQSGLEVRA